MEAYISDLYFDISYTLFLNKFPLSFAGWGVVFRI